MTTANPVNPAPLSPPGLVLADLVPASRVRDLALVVTGTLLVAAASQALVPLPFTPVPLSLATFAVLAVGASLGPGRAAASLALYVMAGVLGVGWFAGGASGWHFASFGYLLGYAVAAPLVGRLARAGADRRPLATIGAMLLGSAVIYAAGVPWLAVFLGVGFGEALTLGVAPFLVGDVVKSVLAALVLPGAWWLVGRAGRRER